MSLRHNLLQARSYIAVIFGFLIAFSIVLYIEKNMPADPLEKTSLKLSADFPLLPPPQQLTFEEAIWARVAWQYFVNNTQATGLVNALDNQPYTSMWDTGSYLMAMISAQRLGIITRAELNSRMSQLLTTLAQLPLSQQKLPALYYHTQQLDIIGTPPPATEEPGWSAVDISRLLMPLNLSVWLYPEQTEAINQLLASWHLNVMFVQPPPSTAFNIKKQPKWQLITQNNRPGIGYRLYATHSLQPTNMLAGIILAQPSEQRFMSVDGVELPYDGLIKVGEEEKPVVVAMPYILTGLETGFDLSSAELAWRIVKVQESRYKSVGDTAYLSNDHEEQPPDVSGEKTKGEPAQIPLQLSTRAVFGWYALFRSPWSESVRKRALPLLEPGKGWYDGIRASDGKASSAISANTNAIILESLAYLNKGPLLCPSCNTATITTVPKLPQDAGSPP